MHSGLDESVLRSNLTDLQASSLRVLTLFTGLVGYIWMVLTLWPVTGARATWPAWIGTGSLVLGVSLASVLRRRLRFSSALLITSTLVGVTCAVLAFQQYILACLFFMPILFAGVLLGERSVFLVAGLAIALSLAATHGALGYPLYSPGVFLPVGTIVLAASASWLSAHNLYIALDWAWRGYEQAHANERTAREGQAELRRALKALDEATYRLERANYMLSVARDQAEEARRLKQQFAQTISHELRTPLNLIVGFTELMAETPEYYGGQLPPAYVRDLGIVHRNACHLQTLVNDVLDLARIEAAQMGILPEETDPAALLEEAVNTARSLVESRGLALHTEIEPDLPQLWVDATRIRQVLFNLLNNAARFTDQGSITVSVQRRDGEVVFSVADTGVGIPPEDMPRVFQEFQQLDGTTRRRHSGVGLGLAISRRFVELHGGRIWVESEVDQGSTFFFSLPTGRSEAIIVPGDRPSEPGEPAARELQHDRILLAVTRSPSAAALLARYVRGCRTVVAHDLRQARRMAQRLMPQAVIIDAACERVDAAQLQRLAQAWEMPQTPFMACALPGEEPLQERLVVDGYLVKPVSRQSLWDVLRQFGEAVDSVLAVDDDRDFIRLVARLLDSPVRRYQVTGAYTGQEGLAILSRRRPDLILLDLRLPDMDGLQIVERVRATSAWRDIPIVVVSAQDEAHSLPAVTGPAVLAKGQGLAPGEVVQWVQSVVDMGAGAATRQTSPAPQP